MTADFPAMLDMEPMGMAIDRDLTIKAAGYMMESGRMWQNAAVRLRRLFFRLARVEPDLAGFLERVELEITWPTWRRVVVESWRLWKYRVGSAVGWALHPWNRLRYWARQKISASKKQAGRRLRSAANRVDPPRPDLWDYGAGEGIFGMRVVMDPTLPPDAMMLEPADGGAPTIVRNLRYDDTVDAMEMAMRKGRQ